MPTQHFIREFGYIGTHAVPDSAPKPNYCQLPEDSYKYLRDKYGLTPPDDKPDFLRLRKHHGHEAMQVVNYVGLLQTPDGTQLEILPKTTPREEKDPSHARAMLWKMLRVAYDIRGYTSDMGSVDTLRDRWLEALIKMVLDQVGLLIKHGIRHLYVRRDDVSTFLKGQLRVAAQMRARPGTEHKFAIRYDQFIPDRPENRLIKSCLLLLNRWTQTLESKRLCKQYLFVFDEVPPSTNHIQDLNLWRNNRNMAYYQPLLPWVRLILSNRAPVLSAGDYHGISLLFPMERLFESYVEKMLRKQVKFKLVPQARGQSLVTHQDKKWFRLKPDLLIQKGRENLTVLDTKWKLLDEKRGNSTDKYNISQGDFYQMLAYGEKYLQGEGSMALIYPRHGAFKEPLPVFSYNDKLHLWALPFDLDKGELICPKDEHFFHDIMQ